MHLWGAEELPLLKDLSREEGALGLTCGKCNIAKVAVTNCLCLFLPAYLIEATVLLPTEEPLRLSVYRCWVLPPVMLWSLDSIFRKQPCKEFNGSFVLRLKHLAELYVGSQSQRLCSNSVSLRVTFCPIWKKKCILFSGFFFFFFKGCPLDAKGRGDLYSQ